VHSRAALELIREVCREYGASLLLVSHDEEVLREFERVRDFRELNEGAREISNLKSQI
jgi:ABC-type lipoprotein export system ATPase subunit